MKSTSQQQQKEEQRTLFPLDTKHAKHSEETEEPTLSIPFQSFFHVTETQHAKTMNLQRRIEDRIKRNPTNSTHICNSLKIQLKDIIIPHDSHIFCLWINHHLCTHLYNIIIEEKTVNFLINTVWSTFVII